MSGRVDPNLLKFLKAEIEQQIKEKMKFDENAAGNIKNKIGEIDKKIAILDQLAKMAPAKAMERAGAGGAQKPAQARTAHMDKVQPSAITERDYFIEQRKLLEKQLEASKEHFSKVIKEKENYIDKLITDKTKDSAKESLGVQDVKVLKSKVETLEKIVKALMASSKSAGSGGKPGAGVASSEIEALKATLKQQEKKMGELAAEKDKMLKKVNDTLNEMNPKDRNTDFAKGMTGKMVDPVKMGIVEKNLARLDAEKKMLQDSIKVIQTKQSNRQKEIAEAVAAATAKMAAEHKAREKVQEEQLRKLQKQQDAMLKQAMEELRKNIVDPRLAALETALAQLKPKK